MHAAVALLAIMAASPLARGATSMPYGTRPTRMSDAPATTRGPEGHSPASIAVCEANTKVLLEDLTEGKADAAMESLGGALRSRLNAKGLTALWGDLGGARSPYVSQARVIKGLAEVTVPLHFPAGDFIARLSCGPDDKFSDFQLTPLTQPLPSPGASPTFTETELRIGAPSLPVGATLTLPNGKGPFPAVVLVSGAGTHNRDEAFGPTKPLRDIAHGLAAYGIASLRYDKPAFDHPLAFIGEPYTIDDEYTNPAIDAVHRLREMPMVDPQRIFLLGHSQGGEMAPRIARREPSIAGLILVAAPAKSLPQYFQTVEQSANRLLRLYPQYASQIRQNVATTEATQRWLAQADPADPAALAPDGAPASYWLSLRDYKAHVLAIASTLKQPMLILQGGRDDSVSPEEDFGLWQQAFAHSPRATLKEYPTLSHLMTPVSGSKQEPADSEKSAHVAPQVIEDIARWILTQKPAHERPAAN